MKSVTIDDFGISFPGAAVAAWIRVDFFFLDPISSILLVILDGNGP